MFRAMCIWLGAGFALVIMAADDNLPLGDRVVRQLSALVRLDTTNPPGAETRVAAYLKQITLEFGIPSEDLGADPRRHNFIARLRGNGKARPLLLFAQSDTQSVGDRAQWTFDPFSGDIRNGFVLGRGSRDNKALLAAQLSVFLEIKRRNIPLQRDIILCVEADGAGSSGMQWLLQNHWPKLDAEFAIGEGGYWFEAEGRRAHLIQTAEKLPLRIQLTARPSIPGRPEPAIYRLSRALIRLADAEPAIRLTPVTKSYFRELAKLQQYEWLLPLMARLENPGTANAAARDIRARNPELEALLHDTLQPVSMRGGGPVTGAVAVRSSGNAEAVVEVRRLPGEGREEVLGRLRALLVDSGVEVGLAPGSQTPLADASPLNSVAFRAMQSVLGRLHPEDIVSPYIALQPTGNAYLRSRGVAVYGLPLFGETPANGSANGQLDEKMAVKDLQDGVELLWQIVLEIAGAP
jgi:acetylornithine deacetylase/succinyl-diaminopimelate desuccinylase-like protein